ncbi:MAG: hypothetical protein SCI25_04760 [Desulfuromonadales bacterium]|nr:hypothetical protein [Desulfuromonadales bacterium]MDW7757744.1 hypothetical protein [Desulfuromonadales bacterium]
MNRKLIVCCCLVLLWVSQAMAEEQQAAGSTANGEDGAKMISGMSIVGNDEAPKSLFIVPWKSSELGVETSLTRTLDERDVPVDRDVFMRQLDFYEVSTGGNN